MVVRARIVLALVVIAVGFAVALLVSSPQEECRNRRIDAGKPLGGLACDTASGFPAGKQFIPIVIALPIALIILFGGRLLEEPRG